LNNRPLLIRSNVLFTRLITPYWICEIKFAIFAGNVFRLGRSFFNLNDAVKSLLPFWWSLYFCSGHSRKKVWDILMIVAVHEGVIIAVPVRIIATVTSSQTYLRLSQNVSCQLSLCNVFILTGVSSYKWVEVICTWLWILILFLFPINPRTKPSKCVKIHIKPTALTFSDVKPIKNY
jgi:hypothetical protein